jgi:hypothetical protein
MACLESTRGANAACLIHLKFCQKALTSLYEIALLCCRPARLGSHVWRDPAAAAAAFDTACDTSATSAASDDAAVWAVEELFGCKLSRLDEAIQDPLLTKSLLVADCLVLFAVPGLLWIQSTFITQLRTAIPPACKVQQQRRRRFAAWKTA